ncbi:hypothetical protein FOVG_10151 [Fusarium oxysporum f. sp. pisi HDV247]|uniref:Uncharacterized protein n=1 Tax=Fusarium oxysporum f. sp. pisi HDV247 TaxID=1080344 RepID=W9NZF0_FUSOX|nr:hypothetical protein FOVG_10151 [Fusarium oxysporum f. sp. pisi HDV247]
MKLTLFSSVPREIKAQRSSTEIPLNARAQPVKDSPDRVLFDNNIALTAASRTGNKLLSLESRICTEDGPDRRILSFVWIGVLEEGVGIETTDAMVMAMMGRLFARHHLIPTPSTRTASAASAASASASIASVTIDSLSQRGHCRIHS